MRHTSTLSTASLVIRHLRSRSSTSITLALLVAVAVAVSALLPRALVLLSDAELHHQIDALPMGAADLYGSGDLSNRIPTDTATSSRELFDQTDSVLAGVPARLPAPLADTLGPVTWVALLPKDILTLTTPRLPVQPVLSLAVDLDWQKRVTFTEGSAPAAWDAGSGAPLEIALSDDFAAAAGFAIGDTIDYLGAPLLVSGIYTVDDPLDSYWVHAGELRSPTVVRSPGSPTLVRGAAFIEPISAAGLPALLARSELRAWYPVLTDTITYATAPIVSDALRRTVSLGFYASSGEFLAFQTGLPDAVDRVAATVATTNALLALAGSAPLGALLIVLALGTRAVLDRRRPTVMLASSRGAGSLQLRWVALVEGLIISVPGALLAVIVTAAIVPVPVDGSSYALPVIIALAVPVLFVTSNPRHARESVETGSRSRTARWVLETVTVGVAGSALFLLVRRGLVLTGGGEVDPLLAATPLLLALVVCVVVLRIYPLPLRGLQGAAGRGTSPVSLVGATGAARADTVAFGSVFAMVIGVSAAIFSIVVVSTVITGLGTAATRDVGSDIRVEAVTLDDLAAVDAVDGVRAVAGVISIPGVTMTVGRDAPQVTVVFADLSALHDVRPDIPPVPTGSILVSTDIANRDDSATELNGYPVTIAGTISALSLPQASRSWVLADLADFTAIIGTDPSFESALVATEPGADTAAVARAVRAVVLESQQSGDRARVTVFDTQTQMSDIASRPSITGLTVALLAAAAVSVFLCLLAVALAALKASITRSRTRGILRLLGMTDSQLRGVLAWEFAPVTIAALVFGTAFGIGLAVLVTMLVDLRALVGGLSPVGPTVPWLVIAATVVGIAVVVAATAAVASAATRRVTAAVAVKMGAP